MHSDGCVSLAVCIVKDDAVLMRPVHDRSHDRHTYHVWVPGNGRFGCLRRTWPGPLPSAAYAERDPARQNPQPAEIAEARGTVGQDQPAQQGSQRAPM